MRKGPGVLLVWVLERGRGGCTSADVVCGSEPPAAGAVGS